MHKAFPDTEHPTSTPLPQRGACIIYEFGLCSGKYNFILRIAYLSFRRQNPQLVMPQNMDIRDRSVVEFHRESFRLSYTCIKYADWEICVNFNICYILGVSLNVCTLWIRNIADWQRVFIFEIVIIYF